MPRRAADAKPAVSFPHRTAAALADALGVHRNTVGAWRAEGAPSSLDEFQWRTWAAAMAEVRKGGYECPKDPAPALLELLANAGVGGAGPDGYRNRRGRHQPVLGTGPAPSTTVPQSQVPTYVAVTPEDRKALADAIIAETKALDSQADSLKRRNQLVSVEDLNPLLDAWLQSFDQVIVTGLAGVHLLCSPSPEIQTAMRNTLDRELRVLRQRFGDETEQRLKEYLEKLAGRAA